ncbi:DUF1565 domain-containing protein [Leptolyngbya sp. FACHB-261]|uniref:DUF1565 domain-containing protein n=1 Tax=Leptolyngbya sp. FACHB-261 TaxID=2692806 RepID=UPI00168217EA|nr:DUF1565 domain-containing protein [Leptolyngbya sp. FACHB-261]MBD2101210.1 DUF1565 domain-containing protein [Leptolyngbya sp. FACHB-261]
MHQVRDRRAIFCCWLSGSVSLGMLVSSLVVPVLAQTPTPNPSPIPGSTPSPTPSPSSTPGGTPTPSLTPVATPSPAATPSPTTAPTPSPTPSPTPGATSAPSPTLTPAPAVTPTPRPTPSPSPAPTLPGSSSTSPQSQTVIYVNPAAGADSPGAGSQNAPFRTISYALSQAQPGTTIQLAPGRYTTQSGEQFPLVLKPGISIQGDDASRGATVVINGGGQIISPTFARQSVTIQAANNTRISGVTLTNTDQRGTGLWIEDANATVSSSTFTGNGREGVFVAGRATPTLTLNIFQGNRGNGISIAGSSQPIVRDSLFQQTGFGINVGQTSAPQLVNNQVRLNEDGIVVQNTARPVLRRNIVADNRRDGLVLIADAQPDLGTAAEPGANVFANNAGLAIKNATRTITLTSYGNLIPANKTSGQVNIVSSLPPGQFSDVAASWAADYIQALAQSAIIGGFPDGSFRPDAPVTRAQFATILQKAFQPTAQRPGTTFSDVPANYWANAAIQGAYRSGFMSGYGGQFQPEQNIPRVQVLVALTSGLGLTPTNPDVLSRFQDAAEVPSYAVNGATAATERRLVVTYPDLNRLNPNRPATRADVAAFVYQALVSTGRLQPINSPYIATGFGSSTPVLGPVANRR